MLRITNFGLLSYGFTRKLRHHACMHGNPVYIFEQVQGQQQRECIVALPTGDCGLFLAIERYYNVWSRHFTQQLLNHCRARASNKMHD